jgi:hypothetical protein
MTYDRDYSVLPHCPVRGFDEINNFRNSGKASATWRIGPLRHRICVMAADLLNPLSVVYCAITGAVIDVRAEFLDDGLGITGVPAGRDLNRVRRRASCPLVEPPPTHLAAEAPKARHCWPLPRSGRRRVACGQSIIALLVSQNGGRDLIRQGLSQQAAPRSDKARSVD